MSIRTKIVATVGPASGDIEMIRRLVQAGVDVFRINFSHGTDEQHEQFLAGIREVEADRGRPIAVMADLCGPKIRVGPIDGSSMLVGENQRITIQREPVEGRPDRISTTLGEIVQQVRAGDAVLLDDGKIRLEVVEAPADDEFVCKVVRGGILATGKGVNLPDTPLDLPVLTEKDRRDVEWLAGREFDYVAMSFVRTAKDIAALRDLLQQAGDNAHIVAKIEKPQAVENIQEIAAEADAIMVARGDLGVEMDLPAVPVAQKRIARICQEAGKPCIIATQMLESMTTHAVPSRAEVSDVANAVLDHTDAVMLSGETAVGKFPVETVTIMNEIVASVQAYHDQTAVPVHVTYATAPTTAALAAAVREIIAAEKIAAIAVFTITGATARMFSKHRVGCPILGLSPHISTVRRMCLYYGVVPMQAEMAQHTREVLAVAGDFAQKRGIAKPGDKIIVISGRPLGEPGNTNTLVIHTIENKS